MSQQTTGSAMTGVRNFRDVGGVPTTDGRRLRRGVLFRSGHLARATPQDAAFLSGLGLHSVFDFRNSADQALEGPDVQLPGVRQVDIPLSDPADGAEFWKLVRAGELEQLRAVLGEGQAAARMISTYRSIVVQRTAELGRVLRTLADGGVPALMHCAAGKDRAGLSVALTLLALGVDRDAIEADYLLSNSPQHRYRVHRGDVSREPLPEEVQDLISPLFDARASYLAAALATMDDHYGGVEAYLSDGIGLDEGTRERLRSRMLEDA